MVTKTKKQSRFRPVKAWAYAPFITRGWKGNDGAAIVYRRTGPGFVPVLILILILISPIPPKKKSPKRTKN